MLLSAAGIGGRSLAGASLGLRGGEVVALMGENSAGKTTLLRICAGLCQQMPARFG
jgi:ABC-type multidrug transport system ATPase subunit